MAAFDLDRLDDAGALASADSGGMLRALADSGAQIRRGLTLAGENHALRAGRLERPRAVVVAAMGADDLVADVLATLAAARSPVPVWPTHDLPLPGWVGSLDLVIAVSLSGRAGGPVRLAHEAARRGAALIGVGAADSPLAHVTASARGVFLPADAPHAASRAAAWALLTPALLALSAADVLPVAAGELAAAADRIDAVAEASRPTSESFVSPAKSLAVEFADRLPLVLGDGPLAGVAARRAGTMLARTARVPALTGVLPDAAASILACLDGPYAATRAADGGRDIFADPDLEEQRTETGLLMVRDADPRTDPDLHLGGLDLAPIQPDHRLDLSAEEIARINLAHGVSDLAEARGARVRSLTPAPGPDLARLAELVATLDFAATYLALGHGYDPAHAPAVAELRDLLT